MDSTLNSKRTLSSLPALYPIANIDSLRQPLVFVEQVLSAGAEILQLRSKQLDDRSFLDFALKAVKIRDQISLSSGQRCVLLLNDRVDLSSISGADGVHLGQDDLPVPETRKLLGEAAVIGLSTHNRAQLESAPQEMLDYLAIGPIFQTSSKRNPDPTLGLNSLQDLSKRIFRPLVAIGGITEQNADEVFRGGAQSVAMISALERCKELSETIARVSKLRAYTQAVV
ncbi:MAG: thiamine phosphate synthase [Bdellovibrionales bacterium]|nr:thiamine phosphate synthase [Bdellovibrionales bacterium]